MATPIEFVDKQWEEWPDKNPAGSFTHIDTDSLKQSLIKDLEYASKMDVREYTLYQKWCEVQERYPTHETSSLFGDSIEMVDPEQKTIIEEVKKKFWMPTKSSSLQAFQKKPKS